MSCGIFQQDRDSIKKHPVGEYGYILEQLMIK